MQGEEPWAPAVATKEFNRIAKSDDLVLSYKVHAKERLADRGLIQSDVLHVLKYGFVYENPEPATRPDHYKYKIESQSPNSGSRSVRLVIIPGKDRKLIKIVTVMWVD